MDDDSTLLMATYARVKDPAQARLTWGLYFVLGAGLMTPWNAFITATDYFSVQFPGEHMDRLFTVAYLPVCLLLLALTIRWPNVVVPRKRIASCYLGFTLTMSLLLVMMATKMSLPVVLALVLTIGILDGFAQGAVFGDAAQLPSTYTHALVGGTSAAGLIISILRVCTKAAFAGSSNALYVSTTLYFGLGVLLSAACWIIYVWVMPTLPIVRYYKSKAVVGDQLLLVGDMYAPGSADGAGTDEATSFLHNEYLDANSALAPQAVSQPHRKAADDPTESSSAAPAPGRLLGADVQPVMGQAQKVWRCFCRIWQLASGITLIYVVTLSIFPGFLSEDIHLVKLGDWYPITLFVVFNLGDFVGKVLPSGNLIASMDQVLWWCVARVLFVPAFTLGASFEAHPAFMAILTILLGLSNGYLTATAMTMAPDRVAASDADLAENVLVLCLVAGLNIGAGLGWVWLFAPG